MTERIKKAIDIFLDAINEGTLAKGSCVACAVGNLVANGVGGKITSIDNAGGFKCSKKNTEWSDLFLTDGGSQTIEPEPEFFPEALEEISRTDFSLNELAAIEFAFERNCKIDHIKYYMYSPEIIRADQIRGLEAVVKVMLTFDDCKESVQEVFTSKAELIPV